MEPEIGDITVSLNEDAVDEEPEVSLATGKKGPSKRERQFRLLTHCLHVQLLMWHNTVRNSWLNDTEVQKSLLDALGDGVKKEITRWRENMGALTQEELQAKKAAAAKIKARQEKKGKAKGQTRNWSYAAERLEQGVPNLTQGDPLLRLLKVLAAYWRKRFTVTAPAIRKQGYMPLRRLREEIKHWENNEEDADEHGERIKDIHAFRKLAKTCEASRDVGAQLFVALLRGIGLEARMVANLQPAGTGFSKAEEANEKKSKKARVVDDEKDVLESKEEEDPLARKPEAAKKTTSKLRCVQPSRTISRGGKANSIHVDDSESALSEPPSENEDRDDVSLIDVTASVPKKMPTKKYDRDLAFPMYWTEVCSPVSHKWIPVDPIVLSTIASTDELLHTFEPRGKKAEHAKQVMCYTIAHHADGSAKEVTVRYIKKHQLPGKTKGLRILAEKVPIFNKRGKVKKYESYDWFRTVMSPYDRPQAKRTTADDLEEQTDLKPFKPVKEAKEVEKESLQWYKQSAEFVLEQHLRREEAIVPGAKLVRTFLAGKGDRAVEYPVYKRSDVVNCKTVESWHKEGRAVKLGEHPMKHVPVRAVTLIRKREMEEHFKEHGEKLQQGLYGWDQTDWIIPPPIENGVIPKNAFGNMDVYVETMVPGGAVHLPLKGSAKICKKLEIDYAEACTGFEFGKQRAVPVLTGVVVAEEHEILVRDAWKEIQKEIERKEDTKRTAAALHWWRKMVMGMRIVERMRAEYHDTSGDPDAHNPFAKKAKAEGRDIKVGGIDEDSGAGGFLQNEEEPEQDVCGNGLLVEEEVSAERPPGGINAEEAKAGQNPVQRSTSNQELMQKKKKKKKKKTFGAKKSAHWISREAMAPTPSIDEAESSLSEDEVEDKSILRAEASEIHRERSSPQVIVSPVQESAKTGNRASRSRAMTPKATATKSRYFQHEPEKHNGESEHEVIRPTRTTARTRTKK